MALVYARTVPLLLGLVGRRDGQGFQELLAPRRHLLGLNLDRIANLKSVGLNLLLAPQDLRFAGEVEIQQIPFGGLDGDVFFRNAMHRAAKVRRWKVLRCGGNQQRQRQNPQNG